MTDAIENRCGYCAIIGRPNVGKSTLLNRMIGQKLAITSHKPQTTRHSIIGVKTMDHGQIVYVDTPGIHQRTDHAMNRYLNRTAKTAVAGVDLLLFVVEALCWTEEDQAVLDSIGQSDVPAILIVNKVDKQKQKDTLLPFLSEMSDRYQFLTIIPASAKKGDNLAAIETRVLSELPERNNFFPDDQISDRSERFFAAELIREKLTRRYAQEIPYALTVEIEKFQDEGGLYRIHGLIWVERPGQKNIIIGSKGEALKEVATQARIDMEKFFGKKVFLQLWVKVKKSWSSDEAALNRLGYSD
ncbi:MAG: GTPase Era [Sedimenticola sp.]